MIIVTYETNAASAYPNAGYGGTTSVKDCGKLTIFPAQSVCDVILPEKTISEWGFATRIAKVNGRSWSNYASNTHYETSLQIVTSSSLYYYDDLYGEFGNNTRPAITIHRTGTSYFNSYMGSVVLDSIETFSSSGEDGFKPEWSMWPMTSVEVITGIDTFSGNSSQNWTTTSATITLHPYTTTSHSTTTNNSTTTGTTNTTIADLTTTTKTATAVTFAAGSSFHADYTYTRLSEHYLTTRTSDGVMDTVFSVIDNSNDVDFYLCTDDFLSNGSKMSPRTFYKKGISYSLQNYSLVGTDYSTHSDTYSTGTYKYSYYVMSNVDYYNIGYDPDGSGGYNTYEEWTYYEVPFMSASSTYNITRTGHQSIIGGTGSIASASAVEESWVTSSTTANNYDVYNATTDTTAETVVTDSATVVVPDWSNGWIAEGVTYAPYVTTTTKTLIASTTDTTAGIYSHAYTLLTMEESGSSGRYSTIQQSGQYAVGEMTTAGLFPWSQYLIIGQGVGSFLLPDGPNAFAGINTTAINGSVGFTDNCPVSFSASKIWPSWIDSIDREAFAMNRVLITHDQAWTLTGDKTIQWIDESSLVIRGKNGTSFTTATFSVGFSGDYSATGVITDTEGGGGGDAYLRGAAASFLAVTPCQLIGHSTTETYDAGVHELTDARASGWGGAIVHGLVDDYGIAQYNKWYYYSGDAAGWGREMAYT